MVSEGWIEYTLCDDHCAALGCRLREDKQSPRNCDNSTRQIAKLLQSNFLEEQTRTTEQEAAGASA
jgi:hypothetical protein